jgi:hypothetical protein
VEEFDQLQVKLNSFAKLESRNRRPGAGETTDISSQKLNEVNGTSDRYLDLLNRCLQETLAVNGNEGFYFFF